MNPNTRADTDKNDVEKHTRTIRNTVDEHVYVEWFTGTPISPFVNIHVEETEGEQLVSSFDTNELPHAVRALQEVTAVNGSVMVRDMGHFERIWFESEDGLVTLLVEKIGEIEQILVLDADEASALLSAVETAKEQIEDVEDDPYV